MVNAIEKKDVEKVRREILAVACSVVHTIARGLGGQHLTCRILLFQRLRPFEDGLCYLSTFLRADMPHFSAGGRCYIEDALLLRGNLPTKAQLSSINDEDRARKYTEVLL